MTHTQQTGAKIRFVTDKKGPLMASAKAQNLFADENMEYSVNKAVKLMDRAGHK